MVNDRQSRMLGLCHVVGAGGLLLAGILFLSAFDNSIEAQWKAQIFLSWLFAFVAILFLVPSIIAGLALWRGREWGRIAVIVISALWLLAFPFGTLLGAAGLWILLRKRSADPAATSTEKN